MGEYEQTPEKEIMDQRQRLRRYVHQLLTTATIPPEDRDAVALPESYGGLIAYGSYDMDNERLLVAELIDISNIFDADAPIEYQLRLAVHSKADGHCEYELSLEDREPLLELLGDPPPAPIASYRQGNTFYDFDSPAKAFAFDTVIANFFEQFEGIIPPEMA